MIVQQVDKVHPKSSVMYEGALADLSCSLCMASLSVCCKCVYVFLVGEFLSCTREIPLLLLWLSIT